MKPYGIIMLIAFVALAGAGFVSGCATQDEKMVVKADKLVKQGEHTKAIDLYSEVARNKSISDKSAQYVQINFCQYYGLPRHKSEMPGDKALAVAESCAAFYENFPNRTSEGLGPFQTGVIFKDNGQPKQAVKMFQMAADHDYYDKDRTAVNQKQKENCGKLYGNMISAYSAIPGQAGEQGAARAMQMMQDVCHISVQMSPQ